MAVMIPLGEVVEELGDGVDLGQPHPGALTPVAENVVRVRLENGNELVVGDGRERVVGGKEFVANARVEGVRSAGKSGGDLLRDLDLE